MSPIGPAPVISTSSPSTGNVSVECTALPNGSKIAATSRSIAGSWCQTLVIGSAISSANAPGRSTPTLDVLAHKWRRPARQFLQRPQTTCPSPLTSSPGWKSLTFDPTETTSPTNSWPITRGGLTAPCAHSFQSKMCRSVPQIPVRSTRISTSLMPICGSGTWVSVSPGPGACFVRASIASVCHALETGTARTHCANACLVRASRERTEGARDEACGQLADQWGDHRVRRAPCRVLKLIKHHDQHPARRDGDVEHEYAAANLITALRWGRKHLIDRGRQMERVVLAERWRLRRLLGDIHPVGIVVGRNALDRRVVSERGQGHRQGDRQLDPVRVGAGSVFRRLQGHHQRRSDVRHIRARRGHGGHVEGVEGLAGAGLTTQD